jgi:mediator of RNA polymerase II transcription subunit 12, fungi type
LPRSAIPPVLPEILLLTQDDSVDAAALLAASLWSKYGTSPNWVLTIWDNVVASLRQLPDMSLETSDRKARALRYVTFLRHIGDYVLGGIDLADWFLGPGKHELVALDADVWELLNLVLIQLCIHGTLLIGNLLVQLVYPTCQGAAEVDSVDAGQAESCAILASIQLFRDLVVHEDASLRTGGPFSVTDIYSLCAYRQELYRSPQFTQLLHGIKAIEAIEQNVHLADEVRSSATSLRQEIILGKLFRQGLYAEYERLRPISRAASREPEEEETLSDIASPHVEKASLFHTVRAHLNTDALVGELICLILTKQGNLAHPMPRSARG